MKLGLSSWRSAGRDEALPLFRLKKAKLAFFAAEKREGLILENGEGRGGLLAVSLINEFST